LEDGNIKLGSVLEDVFGASGLGVIRALAAGEDSPEVLLKIIRHNVKAKKEDLKKSITHCLTKYHRYLLKQLLDQYDSLKGLMAEINSRIDQKMEKYSHLLEKLDEIPGIDKLNAQVIIAEATTNMGAFPDDRNFAAWAGVAPGNNESGGKKKRARSRFGNPYFKRALIQSATGAVKKKDSYYKAKYHKLTLQTGAKNKAKVAIANRIARAIYWIIKEEQRRYQERGNVGAVRNRETELKRLMKKVVALGYDVNSLEPGKFIVQEAPAA
jgi:hypothetical protein